MQVSDSVEPQVSQTGQGQHQGVLTVPLVQVTRPQPSSSGLHLVGTAASAASPVTCGWCPSSAPLLGAWRSHRAGKYTACVVATATEIFLRGPLAFGLSRGEQRSEY